MQSCSSLFSAWARWTARRTTAKSPSGAVMPIRFACPHCHQKLSVGARKAGMTADCPRCKRVLTVPPAPPEPPIVACETGGEVVDETAKAGAPESETLQLIFDPLESRG